MKSNNQKTLIYHMTSLYPAVSSGSLFILRAIVIILFVLFTGNVSAEDINSEIDHPAEASEVVVKAPTSIGLLAGINYFSRKSNEEAYDYGPSLYTGPGFYFDFRVNDMITISNQTLFYHDFKSVFDDSKTWSSGLFAKHWINPDWGYIGLGFETIKTTGGKNGKEITETDYMISVIITGENVKISRSLNSIGDIKAGFSFSNNAEKSETRFNVQYTLGIGFEFFR